jgi:hypothetical protein
MQLNTSVYLGSKVVPGSVLDIIHGKSNKGALILYKYHGAPNQLFRIVPSEHQTWYLIQNLGSSKYITVGGPKEGEHVF